MTDCQDTMQPVGGLITNCVSSHVTEDEDAAPTYILHPEIAHRPEPS